MKLELPVERLWQNIKLNIRLNFACKSSFHAVSHASEQIEGTVIILLIIHQPVLP